MAKFVKRYAEVHEQMVRGIRAYAGEVRSRHFPEPDHVYSVEPAELDAFRTTLTRRAWFPKRPGPGSRSPSPPRPIAAAAAVGSNESTGRFSTPAQLRGSSRHLCRTA